MCYIIIFLLLFDVSYVINFVIYNWDNNANTTHFLDLSHRCVNGSSLNLFIPLGVGAADGESMLVAKPSKDELPNCTTHFKIAKDHKSHLQILVIEFIDAKHPYDEIVNSCLGENKMGYLTLKEEIDNGKTIYVCNHFQPGKYNTPVFVQTSFAQSVLLQIEPVDVFNTLKLTFTAGRSLGRHQYCNLTYEIQCTVGRETICINKALACDKNINCGVFDENDEDYKVCRASRYAYLWIVVLAGLVTLFMVFAIFVYLLKTYIVEITDNFFIFNEDEDNKLVIKSQQNSYVWQNTKKYGRGYPCSCTATSDSNASVTAD